MKKLIYTLVILASLFISCGKEDNHINEELPVDDTPEDKTEVQHILITANVRENFKLPVGTRCEAEFYDKDGKKVDCKKTLSAASERSFNIGADLDKGKQYTCLLWFDNGSYGYDISEGLKSVRMSTKPSMAFYGKLEFNSETTTHNIEMKPAVAQVVLKLNNVIQTGSGLFSVSEATPINYVFDVNAGTAISTDETYIPKTVFLLNNSGKVAEFYTFTPDGGITVNLQVNYNDRSKTTENATLQSGYATTLEGDLETMIFSTAITDMLETDVYTEM
ncbi:MAG: hypothetical protein ACLVKO_10490 [Dysgonomonas sp.]